MNKLYCLIGPSGSGKDTIKFASGLPYVISYRTRKKRPGEQQGKDGYFISRDQFKLLESNMIAKTEYNGELYGITLKQLEELKSSDMIYVIDWDGYKYMKEKIKDIGLPIEAISVFIDIDSDDIRSRMIKQGRRQEEIEERIRLLPLDLDKKIHCDYIIENKTTVDNALAQLHKIIKAKEATH